MFTTANGLIVGTGNIMLLRNLKGERFFSLSGGVGECVIAGNGILIAMHDENADLNWSRYLLADFGEPNHIKDIQVWVKPDDENPQFFADGSFDNMRRLIFIETGRE